MPSAQPPSGSGSLGGAASGLGGVVRPLVAQIYLHAFELLTFLKTQLRGYARDMVAMLSNYAGTRPPP